MFPCVLACVCICDYSTYVGVCVSVCVCACVYACVCLSEACTYACAWVRLLDLFLRCMLLYFNQCIASCRLSCIPLRWTVLSRCVSYRVIHGCLSPGFSIVAFRIVIDVYVARLYACLYCTVLHQILHCHPHLYSTLFHCIPQ